MSTQPVTMKARLWGPWETRGDEPAKLRALLVAAAVERMGEMEAAPEASKVVESIPNKGQGDAVRQVEKVNATMLSFPVSRTAVGRGVSAKKREGGIDLAGPLVGDAAPGPVADGLLSNVQDLGQAGLSDPLGVPGEYGGEGAPGTGSHGAPLIQQDLYKNKPHLCATGGESQENAPMADLPRPELFSSFQALIQALLQRPGITQKKLAQIAGTSQQAVAAWKKGGKIKPEPLAKLCQWAGYEYQSVRMLVDDKLVPNSPRARAATRSRRDPEVEQIAAMLDVIADDEDGLRLARALVQELVDLRQQMKKRRHA